MTVDLGIRPDLAGLDLTPPRCEALDHRAKPPVQCPRLSVARIKIQCFSCGWKGVAFVCRPCLNRVRDGHGFCGACGAWVTLVEVL